MNEEQRKVILYNAIKDRRVMIYRSIVIFVGLISNAQLLADTFTINL